MQPLKDRIVLITGASRGLGVDMAHAFAKKGARLALAARSAEELEKVRADVESHGIRVIAIPSDVSELKSLRRLVEAVERDLGPIEVLVNNAGVEKVCDFEAMDPDEIEWIVRVNVVGLMWLTRLVVPTMIERRIGHVVNVASMAGLMAVPHNAVYSSSKHAVVGLSRSLRAELVDHNVGVSVVCPGFVEGGMFLEWGRKPPTMAGWVTSQQVADAVVGAVEHNRAEVNVNKGLGKFGDWFTAVAPDLTTGVMKRTGVVGFMREQARMNAERSRH